MVVVCLVLSGWTVTARRQSSSWVPLFDGRTLDGWVVENSSRNNFTVGDGVLRVEGPEGWLRSTRVFRDFDLRVEVRLLTDDADSGVFVRAPGPASNVFARGWPANAYQVQVRDLSRNRTTNPIWPGNIYRHRVPAGETLYDADAALKAMAPTGAWQLFEIEVSGDQLRVSLNGTPVTRASGIVNPEGFVGLQGETGVLEYRAIAVRER
jgi:hypothetical protein